MEVDEQKGEVMGPPNKCVSTHGAAGYAQGSYWDGDDIICGWCGERIKNPPPTGGSVVPLPGFWNRLFGRTKEVPKWPDWILPHKPEVTNDGN